MVRKKFELSRRKFFAAAGMGAAAIALPSGLFGCGDNIQPRELRTLHYDLSSGTLGNLRLHALGSRSHRGRLTEHTTDSRAYHRDDNVALEGVPDHQLTHFIQDVDLPVDALQLLWVTGEDAAGAPGVAAMHIHRPLEHLTALGTAILGAGGDPMQTAKARAYRMAPADGPGDLPSYLGMQEFFNPFDIAAALLFQVHEIMNLGPEQGTTILHLIEGLPCTDPTDLNCTTYLDELVFLLVTMGPATMDPTKGWATLVRATDLDGKPVSDDDGQPVYKWNLKSEVAAKVHKVAAKIKKAIFDDPQFKGTNWHPTQGVTVSKVGTSARRAPDPAAFAVTAEYGPGASAHGITFDSVNVLDGTRSVELTFRNAYLRYLSAYVQYEDADGKALPVMEPTSADSPRAKYLGLINSNYTVLGIPFVDTDIPSSSVGFDVPAEASAARVYFGSLGLGGDAFSPEALDGTIWTLLFNIGVPTMFLAAGAAVSAGTYKAISQFGATSGAQAAMRLLLPAAIGAATGGVASGIFGTGNSGNFSGVVASLGSALLSGLLGGGAVTIAIKAALLSEVALDASFHMFGPIGLALTLISVAGDVAAIAESIFESLASPAIFTNKLSLTTTTTVTIHRDPDDFQFPASARNYQIKLTYGSASSVVFWHSGTMFMGQTAPIIATFDGVPAGGSVMVEVYLTSEMGCLVGASTDGAGTLGAYGPVPGTQNTIEFAIKEIPVTLNAATQYQHRSKLAYQSGKHVWQNDPSGAAAPTATLASLVLGSDGLNDLTAITISQRTGMAGYAYKAGGQTGLSVCGVPSQGGIMHMVQNVYLATDAERGLKQLPCGFKQPAGVVYERLGPASGIGRNFFLQPASQGFLLKSITLDQTNTPLPVDNPLSWGAFHSAMDSMVVVPTGYVVGVNRQTHRMQILKLPDAASDAARAPQSVPFAVTKLGYGKRAGLMDAPVALAVIDASILILEAGNRRIQAVDVSGNPVLRFKGGTTNIVDLDAAADVTYLDIGVEGRGYIYVLSYTNNGMVPSNYRLDLYDPEGTFLARTGGVAAARIAVDTFANVYALNYETLVNAPRVEPSLSQWLPVTPGAC